LTAHQLAICDALPATGHDAVLDFQLVLVHAQLRRGEIQQRLIRIGRGLADVLAAVLEKARREPAVGCAIGVAHHDGRDRVVRDVQLFGDELLVSGMRRGLAKVDLAGAHQDRVVGVNLEP
jgi:hypothetical protein